MSTTLETILSQLNALSNEAAARIYKKTVIDENVIGVNRGPLRQLAKTYSPNHQLGLELWSTNTLETRLMAAMILDPKQLTLDEVENLINQTNSASLIDELTFNVFETINEPKAYFHAWLLHPNHKLQRAAWNMAIVLAHRSKLTTEEMDELIKHIEANLVSVPEMVKYAMNRCLCEIGITHSIFTERCLKLGERLGVYKEVMVSKGCTSPYAPEWIHAVLRRKK